MPSLLTLDKLYTFFGVLVADFKQILKVTLSYKQVPVKSLQ